MRAPKACDAVTLFLPKSCATGHQSPGPPHPANAGKTALESHPAAAILTGRRPNLPASLANHAAQGSSPGSAPADGGVDVLGDGRSKPAPAGGVVGGVETPGMAGTGDRGTGSRDQARGASRRCPRRQAVQGRQTALPGPTWLGGPPLPPRTVPAPGRPGCVDLFRAVALMDKFWPEFVLSAGNIRRARETTVPSSQVTGQ